MNEQGTTVSGALRFPFLEAPGPGTLIEIAPHVKWLRMPLPFALDHINLWVLDDGDAWTLVDSGINTARTQELWQALLEGPLKAKPVARLICTHFHPDHFGLAGWLAEKLKIPLWITPKEWEAAGYSHGLTADESYPLMGGQYTRAGLADALPAAIATRSNAYARRVSPLPASFSAIDPARVISAAQTDWRVVIGEGHSPQLAGLYGAEPGALISGDQVLPGISPNVSVRAGDPEANPLKAYLDSLPRFRALPADTLVLPSHKLPFYGLHLRIDQIVRHHSQRLDLARRACHDGATAGQVLAAMFPRQFDAHQLHFALGETLAHLNYLIHSGEVTRETGGTGIDRYITVGRP